MNHDLNTAKGIRAVSEHLRTLASDVFEIRPERTDDHIIGPLRIRPTMEALTRAADLLKSRAPKVKGFNPKGEIPKKGSTPRFYYGGHTTLTLAEQVQGLDAVKVHTNPATALAAIRRQLDTQGQDMHPPDVKRCEAAATLIERHLEELTTRERIKHKAKEIDERIEKGHTPAKDEPIAIGTQVSTSYNYRTHLATVTDCRTLKNGETRTTIKLTHIKETRGCTFGYHWCAPKELKKLRSDQFHILA